MELSKNKYKKAEVQVLIDDYNSKIADLKEKDDALIKENEKLKNEIATLKADSDLIGKAIISAEKYRAEVSDKLKLKYQTELDNLMVFIDKYRKYFEYIKEKYPYYPAVKTAQDLVACFDKIMKKHVDDGIKVKVMSRLLDTEEVAATFSEGKEKIKEYIESENEPVDFDMDQILNPGELNLEELCKDLGILDEEKE